MRALIGEAAVQRSAGGARLAGGVALALALAAIAIALALAPPAHAEGANGQLFALPDSHRLEGRVEVEFECEAEEPCEWFGAVSAYGLEAECPEELEASHRVWRGAVKRSTATAKGHFTFLPEAPGGATLCIYVELPLEAESELLESVSETVAALPSKAPGAPGEGTRPPQSGGGAPGPSGAGGTSTGALPNTIVSVYRPFRVGGRTTLRTRTRRGYCFSGSSAADRRDAWRCTSGKLIADPCFSANASAHSVICPAGPWSHSALALSLTRPLPHRFADHPRPSLKAQPWAIELFDGRRALFSSGAGTVLEGERLNYFFGAASKEGLWGYPDRAAQPWTIHRAPFDAHALSEHVAIRRAWM